MNTASTRHPLLESIWPCLLFTIAGIAAIELGVGRTAIAWRLAPQSDMGTLWNVEELVIQPNRTPEVIVFGTSRARGAFLPTIMEAQMGRPRGAVLNLALGGTLLFDALVTYERNRPALSRADAAIIQVDPFQFSVGREPSERFRALASFEDRMAYTGYTRIGLLRDALFRSPNVLPSVYYTAKTVLSTGAPPPPLQVDKYGRLAVVLIANDHNPENFTPRMLRYWLGWQYPRYEYSPVFEQQLLKLVAMLRADGVRPYIVHMPASAVYHRMLLDWPGDPYRHFRSRMAQLGSSHGFAVHFWESGSEVGLDEADYRDWGHLNTRGAERWSRFFADWLGRSAADAAARPSERGDALP